MSTARGVCGRNPACSPTILLIGENGDDREYLQLKKVKKAQVYLFEQLGKCWWVPLPALHPEPHYSW